MIKVFGQTDRNFDTNGDIVLRPLKAKVRKEDGGDYYLALETGIEYVDYLVEGNIVTADTPQGQQAFRISNVTKQKQRLTTKAWHVFYDSERYLIADSYVENKNCQNALTHLNNATEPQSEFTVYSDVATIDSYRCVRTPLYNAIGTVLERWGGHLVRDNFNIKILSSIGVDNGVTVQYRKNLKDITCEENWDNVVTKILPVGKDGTLLNAVNPSASIYITSSTQYAIPYTKTVSFSQDLDRDDYSSDTAYTTALVNDLRTQATAYLEKNCVPQVNYTLKANLEKITDIGDVIHVKDDRLGVNLLTNVIAFEYDCILKEYTEVEFGNFRQTLSNLIPSITASIEKKVNQQIQSVEDSVTLVKEDLSSSLDTTSYSSNEYLYAYGNMRFLKLNITASCPVGTWTTITTVPESDRPSMDIAMAVGHYNSANVSKLVWVLLRADGLVRAYMTSALSASTNVVICTATWIV